MAANEMNHDSIPEQFPTLDAAAEFWDSHDLADYEDFTAQVDGIVDLQSRQRLVAIDPALADRLAAEAHRRGLSAEALINLWLNERLQAA